MTSGPRNSLASKEASYILRGQAVPRAENKKGAAMDSIETPFDVYVARVFRPEDFRSGEEPRL
jgi:hypothetical protein